MWPYTSRVIRSTIIWYDRAFAWDFLGTDKVSAIFHFTDIFYIDYKFVSGSRNCSISKCVWFGSHRCWSITSYPLQTAAGPRNAIGRELNKNIMDLTISPLNTFSFDSDSDIVFLDLSYVNKLTLATFINYLIAIVGPWAEFHRTQLLVERVKLDVNCTRTLVDRWWFPVNLPVREQGSLRHQRHFIISVRATKQSDAINVLAGDFAPVSNYLPT